MKKILFILLILFILFLVPLSYGAVVHVLNAPADLYESTSSSNVFNWTTLIDTDSYTESSIYLNDVKNTTVDCDDSASSVFTNASITGTETATWNTLTNYSLNISYTNNTNLENCIVTFTNSSTLGMTEALANITSSCNLSASNSSNLIKLETNAKGSGENITINAGGSNTSGIFGFVTDTTYSGLDATYCNKTITGMNDGFYQWYIKSRDNAENATVTGTETESFDTSSNYILNLTYTVSGTAETCSVTFTQNATLYTTEAIANITSACNISAANSSGAIKLTTTDDGSDEYINITGGNATTPFGFTVGITYGDEDFYSSETRWMEIRDSHNQTFFRWGNATNDVMTLDRNLGNLNITGTFYAAGGSSTAIDWTDLQNYPAACPAGTYITQLNDSTTCTAVSKIDNNLNMTDHNITDIDNLYVENELSVEEDSYFGRYVYIEDNRGLAFYSNNKSQLTGGLFGHNVYHDLLLYLVKDYSYNGLVISNYNLGHDHSKQSDPTVFIQSATNPDDDNTEWLGITYKNATDRAEFWVGKGDIAFLDNVYIDENITINGNTLIGNNMYGGYNNFTGINEIESTLVATDNLEADNLESNLDGTGFNITADNVFIPQYIFSHTNATIPVVAAGNWTNVTFDEEEYTIVQGISHTYNDATNDTFTITQDGTYEIHYELDFEDSAANPDSNVVYRIVKNGVEIKGSVWEIDLDKQDYDRVSPGFCLDDLSANDEIKLQFTSDDNTVSVQTDCTYGDHCDSAQLSIKRIG